MKVYLVAVAVAWRLWEKDEDAEAPMPKKTSKVRRSMKKAEKLIHSCKIKFVAQDPNAQADDYPEPDDLKPSRNYHAHYQNILQYCTAVRILVSRSITPFEAQQAQNFLSEAMQSWARMDCHLTPNCHNCIHLWEYVLVFGPLYGWWVWAYERAIGVLAKVNNNGHGGGEVEGTYMRAWWKTILCQELVHNLALICDIFCMLILYVNLVHRSVICRTYQIVHPKMTKPSRLS